MTTGRSNHSDRSPARSDGASRAPAEHDATGDRADWGASGRGAALRTHHMQYDSADDTALSTAIVRRVAELAGDDPTSIEPLYFSVSPDAIDRLVGDERSEGGTIEFTFHGFSVTATGDGEVTFEPVEEE